MKAPTKKRLEELDEINLLWVLRQFSVGNMVRGFWFIAESLTPVKKRVEDCAKTQAKEIKGCLDDARKKVCEKSRCSEGGAAQAPKTPGAGEEAGPEG